MGNQHSSSHHRKNVHWKSAEPPSPPGKPIATLGEGPEGREGRLRWNPPKYDGGATLQGYMVECNRLGSPIWVRTNPPLVLGPELILAGLESGYQYRFRVSAQNIVGLSMPSDVSEVLSVTTDKGGLLVPIFQEGLTDTESLENEKTEFKVYFDGHPIPTVAWFKDGFEIFSSRRTAIITDYNCSTLIFHQTSLNDEGEIKCTITNRVGHAVSRARLRLHAAPRVRLPRRYEDGLLFDSGETLQLKVAVVGKPAPEIQWRHDGQILKDSERIQITNGDKYSQLKVTNASREDRGEYQVCAVNSIGEDLAAFLVTITAKPDPPRNVKANFEGGKTATITWDPPDDDGGCQLGNYTVEYYRTGWNVWLKATTERKNSATLNDLIEGSEYKFRVKAESPYGMSEPSADTDSIFVPGKSFGAELVLGEEVIKESLELPALVPRRKRQSSPKTDDSGGSSIKDDHVPLRKYRTLDNYAGNDWEENKENRRVQEKAASDSEGGKNDQMSKEDKRKSFQLDLEDAMTPPPLSLSAPQLGANLCLIQPLRNSVSSTELLHEQAMSRMYQVMALKEAESVKNQQSNFRLPKPPPKKDPEPPTPQVQQQSAFEEDQHKSDESLNVEEVSNFDDDYTTSTVSTGDSEYTDSDSLEERRLKNEYNERNTYHPKDMIPKGIPNETEPRVVVVVKSAPLPDPNFIPKPILKKRVEAAAPPNEAQPPVKEEKPKPKSKPLLSKVPLLNRITNKDKNKATKKSDQIAVAAPATAKPQQQNDEPKEENVSLDHIVAERYGNIVKEYGGVKKPQPVIYTTLDEMKKAAGSQQQQQQQQQQQPQQAKPKVVKKVQVQKKPPTKASPPVEKQEETAKPTQATKKQQPKNATNHVQTVTLPKNFTELNAEAETNVRHAFNYIINIFMIMMASWLYFFKSELLAIPFLALAIYRELHAAFKNKIPNWLTNPKSPT